MKLNIIIFEAQFHSGQQIIESRGYLFDSLRAFYDINIVRLEDFSAFAESENYKDPNALTILFVASGGTEESFLNFYPFLKRPFIIVSDPHHNSFAAASEICSWLQQNGINHYKIDIPFNPTLKFFEEFNNKLQSIHEEFNYKNKIVGYRIGLIGGSSSWLIASNINKQELEKEWQIKFVDININEVVEQINNIKSCNINYRNSPIFKEYAHYLEEGRSEEDLIGALIVYEAINNIVIKYKLNALTIKCFDIIKLSNLTACLALAILNDKGIVAGCEWDIPSLFTMIMVKEINHKVSFMANPSSSDPESLTIDFAHCTIPVSMTQSYTLPTHFESDKSIAIRGILPKGEYNILKIGGSSLDSFFFAKGEIIDNPTIPFRCRTQIRFKFYNAEDYKRFTSTRLGNHFILYK